MTRGHKLGLAATGLVVAVLLGSLVLGMRGESEGRAATSVSSDEARPHVRVEVLNASGIPGLARAATERLRDGGFDVVYFGNGRSFSPDSSLVLDRMGKPDAAESVAEAIGIERVHAQPDTTLYLDVTVVVGKDWEGAAEICTPGADGEGGCEP